MVHTAQHAIGYVTGDEYYGAKASINVWAPLVENPSEFSLSQMWVISGSFGDDLNTIEAGWQACCYHYYFILMNSSFTLYYLFSLSFKFFLKCIPFGYAFKRQLAYSTTYLSFSSMY